MPDALTPARLAAFDAFLLELQAAAAAETLPRFRSDPAVDDKGGAAGFDPVTAADRGAELAIRRLIAQRFPDHGVVGEEEGADRPDAEFVWVVDPVDGTRAFISGLPLWTTLIGLRVQGRPALGSIGQPYLDEVFVGSAQGGSRLVRGGTERPLRTRACPGLAQATVAATDPEAYMGADEMAAWRRVRAAAKLTRLGGDGYLFALVAAGGIDLVVESGLKAWDIEPCLPVVEGAGGAVTDWRGRPLDPAAASAGQVVACGDRSCLAQALPLLESAASRP